MADLTAPLAVVELTNGAQIVYEALDPTTSAPVTGVVVSGTAITAVDLSVSDTAGTAPPPLLVPVQS